MKHTSELQTSADEDARGIAKQLLCQATVEVTPGDFQGLELLKSVLGRGSRVYIASVGRHSSDQTISTADRLRRDGFVPVPHIAARRLRSADELRNLLLQLRPWTDEILLVGGDVAIPTGVFSSATEVLKSGVITECAFRRIGIAGYPEGHKAISDSCLSRALADKIELARKSNLYVYIVSQFCFDAGAIANWERRIRQVTGGWVDVHVGIPGVTALGKLLRFATLCGTGASVRFLRKNAYRMARLATTWLPDALVLDLCRVISADQDCRIERFHLFPFGGIDASSRWLKAAQDGLLDAAANNSMG